MTAYNEEQYKSVFDSKFYVPQGSLSATTSIQTANQLSEVNARLNAGVFGVDMAPISPEVVNAIPKQHFEEIKRLTKLSGASASLHGPIIDLAGFSQNKYDELQRKQAEHQMNYVIERAHDLNPEGNTPVNFHINTQIPGIIKRRLDKEEIKEVKDDIKYIHDPEEKRRFEEMVKKGEMIEAMGIVNMENGDVSMVKYDVKYTPGQRKTVYTPQARLENMNETQWDHDKLKVFELQKQKEDREIMKQRILSGGDYNGLELAYKNGSITPEQQAELASKRKSIALIDEHVRSIDTNMNSALIDLYHKFQKYSTEEMRKEVETNQTAERLKKNLDEKYKDEARLLEQRNSIIRSYREEPTTKKEENFKEVDGELQKTREERLSAFVTFVNHLPAPELWASTNKIALEKTAETVANTAFEAYKKFGEHTPIMTMENYRQDLTLGNAEDIKNTIEKSREMFVKKLVSEKGMAKKEAELAAEKTIGVTWDVGHINFLRAKGYSEEEILRQTKIVAPYVKQVHITDNFGFSDAHLPPGMGNSPMSKQLDILKRAGFDINAKGRLIVEGGEFVQQFKENPHLYTLDAFKSPIYPMKADLSFYQIRDMPGVYGSGLGNIYPELHFRDIYGTSFAALPRELGGQFPGEKSRFAGTPNV